jgi:hypothetical protein
MKAVLTYVWSFPFLLPLSIYGAWLSGRVFLGYWPRPSLDDPTEIGGITSAIVFFSNIMLGIGFPIFLTLVGFLLWFGLFRKRDSGSYIMHSCAAAALMAAAILFLRSDPWRVVEWFMD